MAKNVSDQQILDAALQTIIEHGYSGATTRQIAEAAGVNEVTLFRRFGSKKNMLLASIEKRVEEFEAEGLCFTGDVEADLTRIVTLHNCFSDAKGKLFPVLMAELPRQPELTEVLQKPVSIILQITKIIEQHQKAGNLTPKDPSHLVASLIAPLILTKLMAEVHGPELIKPIEIKSHVQAFLQGHQMVDAKSETVSVQS